MDDFGRELGIIQQKDGLRELTGDSQPFSRTKASWTMAEDRSGTTVLCNL